MLKITFTLTLLFCTTIADSGEELMLMGSTPTSTSPGPYSPAKSVHSVGVPAVGSPNSAQSPEYTSISATTGKCCKTDPKLILKLKSHITVSHLAQLHSMHPLKHLTVRLFN